METRWSTQSQEEECTIYIQAEKINHIDINDDRKESEQDEEIEVVKIEGEVDLDLKRFGDTFLRRTQSNIERMHQEVRLQRKLELPVLKGKPTKMEDDTDEKMARLKEKAKRELVMDQQRLLEETRVAIDEEQDYIICREMECPVCLTEMLPPTKIWQCSNGHALCQSCRRNINRKCPTCRESIMGRSTTLEKVAASLYYRKTGLTVGDWDEDQEDQDSQELTPELRENFSFIMEMLIPTRTSGGSRRTGDHEEELGRLLTNVNWLTSRDWGAH